MTKCNRTASTGLARISPYISLDIWRAVAALWVVLFHGEQDVFAKLGRAQHGLMARFMMNGYLGVQIFFVLSGYCITSAAVNRAGQPDGVRKYLGARLKRIFPAYWSALGLTVALMIVAQRGLHGAAARANLLVSQQQGIHLTFPNCLLNMLLLPPAFHQPLWVGVAWTLTYELSFYMIVALALVFVQNAPDARVTLVSVLGALTVLSLAVDVFNIGATPFPFSMFPQFGYGVLVYAWLHQERTWLRKILQTVVIGLTICLCWRYSVDPAAASKWSVISITTINPGFPVALGFAVLLVGLHPLDHAIAGNRLMRLPMIVGTFSYSLYLTHRLVTGAMHRFLAVLDVPQQMLGFLPLLVATVAIGLAYVFYLVCEAPFISSHRRAIIKAEQAVNVGSQNSTYS